MRKFPPDSDIEFTFTRSSGPGGQNVNKVNSKAVLRWNPEMSAWPFLAMRERFFTKYGNQLTKAGDLVLHSDRFRDQQRNCEDCLQKLMVMVESIARAPKVRRETKIPRRTKEKRLTDKKKMSDKKKTRSKATHE